MKRHYLRRGSTWLSTALLAAAAVVTVTASPASAEPHADMKACKEPKTSGIWDEVGYPYDMGDGSPAQTIDGTYVTLQTDKVTGAARGWAKLKAGDYFSIDQTHVEVPFTTTQERNNDHAQLHTYQVAERIGANFTWQYCETIKRVSPGSHTTMQRADMDGTYFTEAVDGSRRGIRLCITRPTQSNPEPPAKCIGDGLGSGPGGWYVDGDKVPAGYPSPGQPSGPTYPDEPDPPAAGDASISMLAFQANTGFLFTRKSGTTVDTQYGMMAGTSPASSNGQAAFQANNGFLYTRSVNGSMHNTQLGMMAGTSPALSGGQIAFQANTSLLFTRNMNTGRTQDLRLGLMAGTSPSIAGDVNSWRIAFQANDGFLYYRDSGGATVNTGYGMMRGTSPSITKLSNGSYVIAFQANTSLLWRYTNGSGSDLSLGLAAGTSPSISANGNAWTIAFQANTGLLFTRSSSGTTIDTRYGMMAGTSPAIRGSRIAFQANTGFLFYRDGTSAAVDTRYGMMAGTNPAA